MKYGFAAAILLYCSLTPTIGRPMEFRIFHQPELNEDVIIGEGPIAKVDARTFRSFVSKWSRDKFGNIVFVLNSHGGDVNEAFRIVAIMDEVKVTTIVHENAICASACASILYISGDKHVVLWSGIVGFHTCYATDGGGKIVSPHDELCNERIGTNSFLHGTDYALVDMFTSDYGPGKMRYINAKDACRIGLCRY
jgi:hypothetical protein